MTGSGGLGRGAAECPYGVVRRVVLATRGAPATLLIIREGTSALKREREKGHEGKFSFPPGLKKRQILSSYVREDVLIKYGLSHVWEDGRQGERRETG
jgi:hypothetical protein